MTGATASYLPCSASSCHCTIDIGHGSHTLSTTVQRQGNDATANGTLARRPVVAALFAGLCSLTVPSPAPADTAALIGWVERITLTDEALPMQAKVDTGADVSSVHADAVTLFTRDGAQWVAFTLRAEDGRSRHLQRPVARFADIKLKTSGVQRRPVVRLAVCVGGQRSATEFNLSQRSAFAYPVLLGRSFLAGRYVVDPAARYLQAPSCN